MTGGRHPSDADREQAAAPLVDRFVGALDANDVHELKACYAEGCVLLAEDGTVEGRDRIGAHSSDLTDRFPGVARRSVVRRQQHGAHAVIGWEGRDADGAVVVRGTSVLEIRRGQVVFEALTETV